jgi:hypothetical protein
VDAMFMGNIMNKHLDRILLPSSIQDMIDEAIEVMVKQVSDNKKIEENSETIYSIVNVCLNDGWSAADVKEYLHNSQYVDPSKYNCCADAKQALRIMNELWSKYNLKP